MNKLYYLALLGAVGTLSAAGTSSYGSYTPAPTAPSKMDTMAPTAPASDAQKNMMAPQAGPNMKSNLNDDDSSVIDNIKQNLTNFPGISVSVFRGDVVLSGTANSQMEKDRIERDVRRISGVRSVDNQIQIK